jgi:hypothetical protein
MQELEKENMWFSRKGSSASTLNKGGMKGVILSVLYHENWMYKYSKATERKKWSREAFFAFASWSSANLL